MAIRLYGQLVMITFMISMLISLGGCTGDEHFSETSSISGIVATESGVPIEGALIRVTDSELRTMTNNNGEFTFILPEGDVELSAASESFVSTSVRVQVSGANTLRIPVNLTLAHEVSGKLAPVVLRLRTSAETFTSPECVMITMDITNNSMETIVVSNWFIEVTDDRGQLVYRTNIESPAYTVAPHSIVGRTENWQWYRGTTFLPIILGNGLTVTGLANIRPLSDNGASIPELWQNLISSPARVRLINSNINIEKIPFSIFGYGHGNISIQNSGCFISSNDELETFLKTNGEGQTLGNIDFSSQVLLGIAGSSRNSLPYSVAISSLNRVAPYRHITMPPYPEFDLPTQIMPVNTGKVICNIVGVSSPVPACTDERESCFPNSTSAWQLVKVPRSDIPTGNVEFIWKSE